MLSVTWKGLMLIMFLDKLALLWLYMLILYIIFTLEVEIEDKRKEIGKCQKILKRN